MTGVARANQVSEDTAGPKERENGGRWCFSDELGQEGEREVRQGQRLREGQSFV